MRITERYAVLAGVSAVTAAWGVLLAQPTALVGSAAIVAWLLTMQYRFRSQVSDVSAALRVTQTVDSPRVVTDDTTHGTVSLTTDRPTPVSITARVQPPISSNSAGATCTLPAGEQHAQQPFEVTWPVAGEYELKPLTLTYTDSRELFEHELTAGTTPTVTVEPRAPRNVHVGEGGTQIASGFGAHDTGRTGSGLKPAELRRYVPGDTADQIDWKATARLTEPYVREFESQTDIETVLLVDHRHVMGDGPDGETKLAFARQVALALVAAAKDLGDPLGYYAVGDEGLTTTLAPDTTASHYRRITDHLHTLTPTTAPGTDKAPTADPVRARRVAPRLESQTQFDTRLRPFFEASDPYVHRVSDRPVFHAAEVIAARHTGTTRTIILTDDTDRTPVVEAVKAAQQGSGDVFVYLLPSALFAAGSMQDITSAYEQYTTFESFRRDLAALPRVRAFEVGPNDRLTRILTAGGQQRQGRVES
jgi:uncharacterized protein (DUF58 family)